MIALIHKKCGAVFAYRDEPFKFGEHLKSEGCTTVNGELIKENEIVRCPYCSSSMQITEMRQKDLSE